MKVICTGCTVLFQMEGHKPAEATFNSPRQAEAYAVSLYALATVNQMDGARRVIRNLAEHDPEALARYNERIKARPADFLVEAREQSR